ncbi:MAG: hypothetical protein FWC82_04040 [Firmicutes bacterium]|nr:hypothetical protein [Bacillota bacterium]
MSEKYRDLVNCTKCGVQNEISDTNRKYFCTQCGSKVADWDDPHFGNNMTNQKFWEKRTKEIEKECTRIEAETDAELGNFDSWIDDIIKVTPPDTHGNVKTPFGNVNLNVGANSFNPFGFGKPKAPKVNAQVYVYENDKPVKDKEFEKLAKSKVHLFAHASKEAAEEYNDEIMELVAAGNFKEAYAYAVGISKSPDSELHATMAGIFKCAITRLPHNDFYELAEGLAISAPYLAKLSSKNKEDAFFKKEAVAFFIIYMCHAFTAIVNQQVKNRDNFDSKKKSVQKELNNWIAQTAKRFYHYFEIILSLMPVSEFADYDIVRQNFAVAYINSLGMMRRLEVVLDANEYQNIKRIKKRLEGYLEDLKVKIESYTENGQEKYKFELINDKKKV